MLYLQNTKLNNLIVILGFTSVYLSQVLYQYFPFLKGPLLLCFIAGTFFTIVKRSSQVELYTFLFICLIFSCFLIVGGLNGSHDPFRNVSIVFFYFTIILGCLFSFEFNFFIKIVKIFVVLNLIAMLYEFFTISYILHPTSDFESFIGRAKGFISYSKEAGSFIILFTLLFIKDLNFKWFPIVFFFSILTGSRLAILVVFFAVFIELLFRVKVKYFLSGKTIFISLISMLVILTGVYFYFISEQSDIVINRLYGALDSGHSSNVQRIDFWVKHLMAYGDYDLLGLLFGEAGRTTNIVGNGAESAYLNLLTDGGVIALLIYLCAIFLMFYLIGPSLKIFLFLLLLICSMQVSRVNIGFLDGTLFWAYFFFLLRHKYNVSTFNINH